MTNENATILIVDDDEEMRDSIKQILTGEGYRVLVASDGMVAWHLLGVEKVDAIISDIRMPKMHGIELLNRVKKQYQIPFILMTGFSNIIETTEAYEIGAADFLSKPFSRDDLLAAIHKVLVKHEEKKTILTADPEKKDAMEATPVPAEELPNQDADYCKLSIQELSAGSRIKWPVYLRLSATKYVKIGNNGEDIAPDLIKKLQQKKIAFIYLRNEEFKKFIEFSAEIGTQIIKSSKIENEKKVAYLKQTSDIILEYSFNQDVDEVIINSAKTHLESVLSLASDADAMLDLLNGFMNHHNALYAHSIGVSLLSGMLGFIKGWRSNMVISKLMLAGFFHDIGKRDIPTELIEQDVDNLLPAELKLLMTHSDKGRAILMKVGTLSGDVVQIVYQHHELRDGSGYPNGLKKHKIHPLARVVSVADELTKRMKPYTAGHVGCNAKTALEQLIVNGGNRFDPSLLVALCGLFNVQYPETDAANLALLELVANDDSKDDINIG